MKDVRNKMAGICLFVALACCWSMVQTLETGEKLPADPATRLGYIVGLLALPALFLIVAITLYSPGRSSRRGQRGLREHIDEMAGPGSSPPSPQESGVPGDGSSA